MRFCKDCMTMNWDHAVYCKKCSGALYRVYKEPYSLFEGPRRYGTTRPVHVRTAN